MKNTAAMSQVFRTIAETVAVRSTLNKSASTDSLLIDALKEPLYAVSTIWEIEKESKICSVRERRKVRDKIK